MTVAASPAGYGIDDLVELRSKLGLVHLELDPWGSLIVTPASDEHETAIAVLHAQLVEQLQLPAGCVRSNSPAWQPVEGKGYVNVPDATVVAPGWRRVGEAGLEPPPLLVVEVASPSTRRVDHTRKLSDYRAGRATLYLMVDLPRRRGSPAVFELWDFTTGESRISLDTIELTVAGNAVRLELTGLVDSA